MDDLRYATNYVWSTSLALGTGVTAIVYQGYHKETGDPVAVKTFNRLIVCPLADQMREFQLMKVLSHENVVKLVAIENEVQSQKTVLIMELCNGSSLFNILADPQNSYGLEEEEFLCLLKDLSAGMKYLRDNNIIHRDLKPGNIMKHISEDGWSIYKLTDFGAARVLDDDEQFMSLHGTPAYLHPDMFEKAVLKHPVSRSFRATVDLWSIGVTLYQVATGSLPFRPFGEGFNKEIRHHIMVNKASGVISGVQQSENGPIKWSKKLPKTCLLNPDLRDLVTSLIAGILECNNEKIWTFDQYFDCVTDIFSRKIFHIFYMNACTEFCLYLHPNEMLEDLKDQIHAQTKVPNSSQLLLFDKSLFTSQINVSAEVSTFPTTSLDQPLILVHKENTNVKDLRRIGDISACFPVFSPIPVGADNDASLAKICCSVAHAVKRLVVKLVRCQELLLRIPEILISSSVENVSKLCSASDDLKQKTEDVSHRTDLLEKNCSLVPHLVSTQLSKQHNYEKLVMLNEMVFDNKKMRDQVKRKVTHLLPAINILNQKVRASKQLQNEWDRALSGCSSLFGCVKRADTYVTKIRSNWEFFVKKKRMNVVTAHDQQFYMIERSSVHQTSKKLLNLYDNCLKTCLQASNKLDEWYSGMQATMVQCQCMEAELNSVNNDLMDFSSSLREAELKSFEISEKLVLLRSAEMQISSSNSNEDNHVLRHAAFSMKNSEISAEPGAKENPKFLSQIQTLEENHAALWRIVEENNNMIKHLTLIKDWKEKEDADVGSELDNDWAIY